MKPQANHRQQEILIALQRAGESACIHTIAHSLNVIEETTFQQRLHESPELKQRITRKFNREAPVTIGKPALVDYLVCEAAPPDDIAKACESWAAEITLAN